jgi:ABC-type antimicrobial peptide transport system permease subunit
MTKSIEIRALETLVNQLDETIAALDKEVIAKVEDAFIERNRTNRLIAVMQAAIPEDARSIVCTVVRQLKLDGDTECDLLQYYDATYGE